MLRAVVLLALGTPGVALALQHNLKVMGRSGFAAPKPGLLRAKPRSLAAKVAESSWKDSLYPQVQSSAKQVHHRGQNLHKENQRLTSLQIKQIALPVAVAVAGTLMMPETAHALGDGIAAFLPASVAERIATSGFLQAWSLIFVSEIGDKTFFIAGLLAMKSSRLVSFAGSMGALSVMTIISVIIGQFFHSIPPGITGGLPLDDYAAVVAFLFFGIKTLREAIDSEDGELSGIEEERAEAEEAIAKSEEAKRQQAGGFAMIAQVFALVFAAEFGDRSFIATIALSAAANPVSVAAGAISAHAVATGIAVAGGALLSKFISEKVIGYIGGSLFIVFAFTTALGLF